IFANSTFFGGTTTLGATGSNLESETVFFNGVDISNDDFITSDTSIGPGDTIVVTQNVQATISSPGATTFFSQVQSEVTLSFDSFLNSDDERFLFDFDVQAELSGNFDLSMPGSALALADGTEIFAQSDSTLTGDPDDFILFAGELDNYYEFFESTDSVTFTEFSDTSITLNIPVEFSPGDQLQSITFRSGLLVNAVTPIPEPSAGFFLVTAFGLAASIRRRR
ncbi:MAG: hypothetical protein ACPGSB_06895, partial [Opitutales bacterium]